eukprot:scaffold6846_cov107-Cylindrotheca_fusiformis.AAC.3
MQYDQDELTEESSIEAENAALPCSVAIPPASSSKSSNSSSNNSNSGHWKRQEERPLRKSFESQSPQQKQQQHQQRGLVAQFVPIQGAGGKDGQMNDMDSGDGGEECISAADVVTSGSGARPLSKRELSSPSSSSTSPPTRRESEQESNKSRRIDYLTSAQRDLRATNRDLTIENIALRQIIYSIKEAQNGNSK